MKRLLPLAALLLAVQAFAADKPAEKTPREKAFERALSIYKYEYAPLKSMAAARCAADLAALKKDKAEALKIPLPDVRAQRLAEVESALQAAQQRLDDARADRTPMGPHFDFTPNQSKLFCFDADPAFAPFFEDTYHNIVAYSAVRTVNKVRSTTTTVPAGNGISLSQTSRETIPVEEEIKQYFVIAEEPLELPKTGFAGKMLFLTGDKVDSAEFSVPHARPAKVRAPLLVAHLFTQDELHAAAFPKSPAGLAAAAAKADAATAAAALAPNPPPTADSTPPPPPRSVVPTPAVPVPIPAPAPDNAIFPE